MADALVVLQSTWFTTDATIRRRCQECANYHNRNIHAGNDPTGPHVGAIQGALIAILTANGIPHGISQGELTARHYGPTTARAVLIFKSEDSLNGTGGPILGPGQTTPDRIVGKQTMVALDKQMDNLQPGLNIPPLVPVHVEPPLEPEQPLLPLDIFIYFRGAPPAQQGTRDTEVEKGFDSAFNTDEYKKTHQPAKPICIFGGRGTTDKSSEAVAEALALRAKTKAGVTIIRGDSVGALTALKAANQLVHKGIKLHYVAIDDGGFSNDGSGEIISHEPPKFNVPGGIIADRKENFFQSFGHNILKHKDGIGGFMTGAEFHGPLEGFRNEDVNDRPNTSAVIKDFNFISEHSLVPLNLKAKQIYAGKAHDAAHKDIDPLIDAVVRSLIKP